MNVLSALLRSVGISALLALLLVGPAHAAKENVPTPGEYGVYAMTANGLTRIITNTVYDDQRVLYFERNKPAHFPLNSIEYFVIYGKHDMQYLTLNNLKPFQTTPLGIQRFMFGRDVPLTVQKKGEVLYQVKPKALLGKGYYALWINDSAWDFIID